MSVLNQSGDEQVECPLCMEPLEVDDLHFFPCSCGYQICRFCWHRIRTDENGLCPACRKAYSENPAGFTPLTQSQVAQLKAAKRHRDQQKKAKMSESRKHLANVRVVQRNLLFVVGLPVRLADPDVLKRHEYFGKFGRIHKVVINQSTTYAGSQGPSASAYVTYLRSEDALRAIQSVNNITIDGRPIKSSLGTTKYCSHFMKNQTCPKSECMYLHDFGDPEASFTKEEMHAGKHQEYEKKLHEALSSITSSGATKAATANLPPPPTQQLPSETATGCSGSSAQANATSTKTKTTTKPSKADRQQQAKSHSASSSGGAASSGGGGHKAKQKGHSKSANAVSSGGGVSGKQQIVSKVGAVTTALDESQPVIILKNPHHHHQQQQQQKQQQQQEQLTANNDDNTSFFSNAPFQKLSMAAAGVANGGGTELNLSADQVASLPPPQLFTNDEGNSEEPPPVPSLAPPPNSTSASSNLLSHLTDHLPSIRSDEDWAAAFGFTKCQQSTGGGGGGGFYENLLNGGGGSGGTSSSSGSSNDILAQLAQRCHAHSFDLAAGSGAATSSPPPLQKIGFTNAASTALNNISSSSNSNSSASSSSFSFSNHTNNNNNNNNNNNGFPSGGGPVPPPTPTTTTTTTTQLDNDELDFDPFQETQKALAELIANEGKVANQRHTTTDRTAPHLTNGLRNVNNVGGGVNGLLPLPPPGFVAGQQSTVTTSTTNGNGHCANSFGSKLLPFLNMLNTNQSNNSSNHGGSNCLSSPPLPPPPPSQLNSWTRNPFAAPPPKANNNWKDFDSAIVTTFRPQFATQPPPPPPPPTPPPPSTLHCYPPPSVYNGQHRHDLLNGLKLAAAAAAAAAAVTVTPPTPTLYSTDCNHGGVGGNSHFLNMNGFHVGGIQPLPPPGMASSTSSSSQLNSWFSGSDFFNSNNNNNNKGKVNRGGVVVAAPTDAATPPPGFLHQSKQHKQKKITNSTTTTVSTTSSNVSSNNNNNNNNTTVTTTATC